MNIKLKTTHNEAEQQLTARISKGNNLLLKLPKITNDNELQTAKTEFRKWDDYNHQLLRKLFTTDELYSDYGLAHPVRIGRLLQKQNALQEIDELKEETKLLLSKLESIKEQLELFSSISPENPIPVSPANAESKRVFIVHGHDNASKEAAARLLGQLNLEYVILHEQPNQGRTIIEKFKKNASESSFAVVLLTPDDKGFNADTKYLGRPRQNVIFELGYFIGKLGRNRVCALYKSGTEKPSDIDGVVYVTFDESGAWKTALTQELKSVGFPINFNDLLK